MFGRRGIITIMRETSPSTTKTCIREWDHIAARLIAPQVESEFFFWVVT